MATLLIMAAGIGKRYDGLKQMDAVGPNGEAIIDYSVYDALRAGFERIVFVIRKSFSENFVASFNNKLRGKVEAEYVYQEIENIPAGISINPDRVKPWGTAHAVLTAKDKLNEAFVVVNADDYYSPAAFQFMADYLRESTRNRNCMIGYRLGSTLSEHGSVSRGICIMDENNYLKAVVEHPRIARINDKIFSHNTSKELSPDDLVSMNAWGFDHSFLNYLESYFVDFIKNNGNDLNAELYLPYVVNELIRRGEIAVKVIESPEKWFGITYKEDKYFAAEAISVLINSGVYPERLWR